MTMDTIALRFAQDLLDTAMVSIAIVINAAAKLTIDSRASTDIFPRWLDTKNFQDRLKLGSFDDFFF